MSFKGFNISIQGFSHIVKGLVCQDSSSFYCNDNIAIAVVADGHGSQKHFRSDIGSKIAVETSIASIKNFLEDKASFDIAISNNYSKVLTRIESNILLNWNNSINEHYLSNPLTEIELSKLSDIEFDYTNIESIYGSTLILAAITSEYWFGIQIGDGNCVSVYPNGDATILIPDDSRLVANLTTSLCDSDAIHNFRHYFSTEIPTAILVSTDGLSSSFFDQSSFLNFNRRIVNQLNDYSNTLENLTEHLHKRSKNGSLDDISIAVVYEDNIGIKN